MSNNLITPIEFDKYDRMSDDVYYLGNNTILKFTVTLSKDINNIRNSFHKEYEYSSKYSNANTVITIRRSFDYYLSIENIKRPDMEEKAFILIGASSILLLRYKLQEVLKWFTDLEFQNLFGKKGKKLIILGRVENIIIDRLPLDRYLKFEPVICDFETEQMPGVRLYLSSETNYVDMTVDKLMGLIYLINSFNMYESAQLMLNYLQRPEFGTNLVSFSSLEGDTRNMEGISAKEGRRIPVKNKGLNDI